MICRLCEREKFIKEYPKAIIAMDALLHTCNQPERSKREDHILIYKDENGNKTPIRDLFNPNYGCGALNTMET